MKKNIALFLTLVLVLSFSVGCSNEKEFVTVVTGGTGGTYYPVGTIFSTLWNEKLGDTIQASAQSSGGSVENLNMLKNGEAQLGIAMANLTLFAYEGSGRFEGNQFEDVRFVSALWPDVTQMVVIESSNINSVSDLAGKSFSVGSAGSGTEYSTKLIMDIVGGLGDADYKAENLSYSDASAAMQNGQIVGLNAEGGIPTSSVAELAASRTKVKILPFSDEEYKAINDTAPYYGRFVVPAGTYSGIETDIETVGVKSALITNANMDEETVYNLTKTIFEYYGEILGSHKALSAMGLDQAVEGLPPVPLHKGALRYYEEKGIDVPEHLK